MKGGTLVSFEGLDGSGKSTQLERVARALRAGHQDLVTTREPTQGKLGQRIRAMARSGERIDPDEELRWFVEDRREHVERVIGPALAAGRIVLTDRYFLSSVAYQGARGLDAEEILRASEAEFPRPNLALLFEVKPKLGLERARARGRRPEPVFEEVDFLTRVAEVFAGLERSYIQRIDGSPDPDAVFEQVADGMQRLLGIRLEIL